MFAIAKSIAVFAGVVSLFGSAALADDYVGTASVQDAGRNAQVCVSHPIKITMADGRASLVSANGAPMATGPIAGDGSFSVVYTLAFGRNGVNTVPVTVAGRMQDGKVIGTLSTQSGCLQNFTLTKQ